jgi:gluconolactonase
MKEKPFHVYHEDFVQVVGDNPTLTLIADSGTDPLFHEAAVWYVIMLFCISVMLSDC